MGNQQDYGKRIYDPRVGRFLSVDPLTGKYPELTPYQFASNTPIRAIDLDGLEATIATQNNVYFVQLKNVTVSFVIRQSQQNFIQAAAAKDSKAADFTVNTQMYEPTSFGAKAAYYWGPTSPQPSSDYQAQGYTVNKGQKMAGRSSPLTFYFAQTSATSQWTAGQGDVPANAYNGFGGGTPLFVNGLKYGATNIYSKNAPGGLPLTGDPGPENRKYLLQRSNGVYAGQNNDQTGKTVLGYNSKTNDWIIVSQQNGVKGMTLDAIRDNLISRGYTSILAFDGSTSSTLVKDKQSMVTPDERKNNTITTGATFTVPNK